VADPRLTSKKTIGELDLRRRNRVVAGDGGDLRRDGALAAAGLVGVGDRVAGDADQPGRETGPLRVVALAPLPGRDEDPLGHVLRIGRVAERSQRERVDEGRPLAVDLGQRALVAAHEALGQQSGVVDRCRHGRPLEPRRPTGAERARRRQRSG